MKCKNCGASWDGRKCDYCGITGTQVGAFAAFPTPFGVQFLTPREVRQMTLGPQSPLPLEQRATIRFAEQQAITRQTEHAARYGLLGSLGAVARVLTGVRF